MNLNIRTFYIIIFFILIFSSCANQIPPSGGEDDRTPPEIISTSPKANTLNFKGNSVFIKFNEYVDRRSLEESFNISPKPKGEIIFHWNGKDVEINFSKNFEKNRTYVISIGRDLKDVRGNNPITSPISFAFSTGNKLDAGKISGKVYSEKMDRIKIFAYFSETITSEIINPEKFDPDFITQPLENGEYSFTNLPDGTYRLFAITDEDRNNLYDKDFEMIRVLYEDIKLNKESNQYAGADFLFENFSINKSGKEFLNSLSSFSGDYIYSNIFPGKGNLPDDYKFYFYFKNSSLSKSEIINNLAVSDTSTGKNYKLIYNWLNDSLLEVFSTEKFSNSSDLRVSIDLKKTKKEIFISENLKVSDKNKSGTISGKITGDSVIQIPVYVILFNNENKFISYSKKISGSNEFSFNDIAEGTYTVFSYIDENENGSFDKGNYNPFSKSERFFLFGKEIKVKGNWNTDNVFIKY